MAQGNGVDEGRIRSYLADRGGSVEDPGGRGLTDEMARAIGLDRPAALGAVLAQMEHDGAITREMRGLRTFRIALTEGGSETAPSTDNGSDADRRGQAASGTVAVPSEGRAMSLRDALARQPAPASGQGAPPAAAERGGRTVSLRDVSLRDATSRQGTAAPGPAPASPAGAPPAPPAKAMSLRDALAATEADARLPSPTPRPGPTYGPADTPRPGPTYGPADTRSTSKAPPPAPPPPPPPLGRASSSQVPAEPTPGRDRTFRLDRKLAIPEPSVNAPPSSIILTAVIVAATGLILLAIILVVVAQSGKHVPVNETVPLSSDACNIVNPDLAITVLGQSAGAPHFVLGECVYDNGTNELIVEVFRQNARALFDNGHGSSAQDVAGLGDGAYYVDGRLRVLKGASLLELALGPTPAPTAPPKLVKLAGDAIARL